MSNKNTLLFNDWLSNVQERVKSASVKVAADQEALTGIKDPNEQGTVAPPAHHDGNNREKLELPTNKCNMCEPNKEHNLMGETSPNGVGEGSYITPVNGDAKDKAATTPTAPLDKIANMLRSSVASLQAKAATAQAPVSAPVKEAAKAEFEMPANLADNADVMSKLASIGAMMIGCEEGQQAVAEVLERRCGEAEAASLIAAARDQAIKAASASQHVEQSVQQPQDYMSKQAAAAAETHSAWFNYYQTDLEKQAYAQGAVDGEQAAQAMAAGEEPAIDGAGEEGLSDEDVMQVIQAMVEAGEIDPEEAEAILSQAGGDGSVTMEEVVAYLQQAVAAGEISPEEAEQVMQSLAAEVQGGAPEEAAAPEEGAPEEAVAKAASVVASLFN